MLSDLAITDPKAFSELAEVAKKHNQSTKNFEDKKA